VAFSVLMMVYFKRHPKPQIGEKYVELDDDEVKESQNLLVTLAGLASH